MSTEPTTAKRTRRAEPINTHTAKNGTVTYWFQLDVGTKPDGSRDRRKFTYRTKKEAQRELRRISSEVAQGSYAKPSALTVSEACDAWLSGKRGIRKVTYQGYVDDLKPVRRYLDGKKLQTLTKADADGLIEWMLTAGRQSPRHYQPGSLAGRVVELIGRHSEGISSADLAAAFPDADVHTCLSGLIRSGRVTRPRRAVYVLAAPDDADSTPRGLKPVTVRSTLTRFTAVVQSFVDQGVLPRNVVELVEAPAAKRVRPQSWTLADAETFRESVRGHRLYACWLMSCYGLRRSEVLGLRWSDIDTTAEGSTLSVNQGRVAVRGGWVVDEPKSERSRRVLPLPADVAEALRALRQRQRTEALALGLAWSDDRFVAVREDAEPVRHDWYSDEFQRLHQRAGLSRILLKGLRNTSVSLMLDRGIPVHIVAAWHGHDPAVSLSIYADAKTDELKAAGASLFG
ncbi:tyrosine-type recombinase/integrase [Mycolicibacterium fortuitum]|uniref:tyrosine-type recombinase/integrase n=1 Tax=Mycolicibacterium fortuitum TaxID=1766 RepID=UPI001CE0D20B|nr:site-specific integrase [Mycolicibacterium fortuitum]MCA4726902.1 tyrosine-type recombinase/integrase [Mycolicibacterium fortuitum]